MGLKLSVQSVQVENRTGSTSNFAGMSPTWTDSIVPVRSGAKAGALIFSQLPGVLIVPTSARCLFNHLMSMVTSSPTELMCDARSAPVEL